MEKYMRRALELAKEAFDEGEVPVGAVVVKKTTGEIVGEGRNMREGAKNALAHAELIAIDSACRRLGGWRLPECAIYVTLEPCPMCIVQRMCVIVAGIFCAAAAIFCKTPLGWRAWGIPALLVTGFGAFTAARQSWLQWNPPEFSTCGRGSRACR